MTDPQTPSLTQLDRPAWVPWTAVGSGLAGVGLGTAALLLRTWEVAHVLASAGAATLVVSTAVAAWWLVGSARARVTAAQGDTLAAKAVLAAKIEAPAATGLLTAQGSDHQLRVSGEQRRLRLLCGWGQLALLPGPVAAVALLALVRPPATGDNALGFALGVAAIIVAFPLLIAERRLHGTDPRRSREARPAARLLRLLVWTLVLGGACSIARSYDLDSLRAAQWVISAAIGLISLEVGLRALIAPFLPITRVADATGLGDSLLGGLVLTRGDGQVGFFASIKERFGIDLAQSWAIRFLKAAALPLAAVLVLIGWLLSGISTIGTSQRGIYERLGSPVAVLQPGLHMHLPWPFGRVVRTEFGIMHELALGSAHMASAQTLTAKAEEPLPSVAPDADPPAPFDRVWTKPHPTDVMYLVPGSTSSGATGIGYQLVMSDVRVLWRIGLDDQSAKHSAYQVAEPAALIRTEALRQLQSVFARTSFPLLIGADRAELTRRLQSALQAQLDRYRSGVEITEVVVDAIHPPLDAVASYHGVQAAEIGAATDVSKARAEAARTHADAQREVAERLAKGVASAAETTATARTDATRFRADLDAFAVAPQAMRLERWLARTGSSLGKAQLTIIDHRLTIDGGATIDLRRQPAATE